jgi:hypothetical protein
VDIETGPLYQDQFDKGLDLAIYGGVLAKTAMFNQITRMGRDAVPAEVCR